MTNQPLIDFIKQQLQLGLTKEKIANELLANGWNNQDIEEGFMATGIPTPSVASSAVPPNIPQMINPNLNKTANINAEVKPATTVNLNPNLSSVVAEPVVIKTESSLNKWVFISLSILLLLAISVSVYFLKDEIVKLPVIKDFFPQEEVVIDPIPLLPSDVTKPDPINKTDDKNLNTVTPTDDTDLDDLEKDLGGTDTNLELDINSIN